VVLTAGDVFTIDRGGLTLVEAQGNATVCVMGRPIDEAHVRAHQPALHERARGFLRQIGGDLGHRFVPYF